MFYECSSWFSKMVHTFGHDGITSTCKQVQHGDASNKSWYAQLCCMETDVATWKNLGPQVK